MAGHRRIDYTAGSGHAEPGGTQRTPDLVANQGLQPIRRVQERQMKIEQGETLLIYDCELLFQAHDQQGHTYIVSHVGKCQGQCEYIVVPVNRKSLSQYKAGHMDLRELMLIQGQENWYSARTTGNPGELDLERQFSPLSESPELPAKGFHHDHKFSQYAGT